jgi:hypothetical protein
VYICIVALVTGVQSACNAGLIILLSVACLDLPYFSILMLNVPVGVFMQGIDIYRVLKEEIGHGQHFSLLY